MLYERVNYHISLTGLFMLYVAVSERLLISFNM